MFLTQKDFSVHGKLCVLFIKSPVTFSILQSAIVSSFWVAKNCQNDLRWQVDFFQSSPNNAHIYSNFSSLIPIVSIQINSNAFDQKFPTAFRRGVTIIFAAADKIQVKGIAWTNKIKKSLWQWLCAVIREICSETIKKATNFPEQILTLQISDYVRIFTHQSSPNSSPLWLNLGHITVIRTLLKCIDFVTVAYIFMPNTGRKYFRNRRILRCLGYLFSISFLLEFLTPNVKIRQFFRWRCSVYTVWTIDLISLLNILLNKFTT